MEDSPLASARVVTTTKCFRLGASRTSGAPADAGSGTGGSLLYCQRRFGRAPGLGLELRDEDAARARADGLDVITCDVMREELPERSVSFASAMDFLEHLPDEAATVAVLRTLARAARDFVFIRHPSFEDIDYLARFGASEFTNARGTLPPPRRSLPIV